MPTLNPDKNLYSVAPVGTTIIIGRIGVLKVGLNREGAINLLTWLILSTNAKPEEIAASIKDACTPNQITTTGKPLNPPPAAALPAVPSTGRPQSPPVATETGGNSVRAFIGDIDEEEAEAIKNARPSVPKTAELDSEGTVAAWTAGGQK